MVMKVKTELNPLVEGNLWLPENILIIKGPSIDHYQPSGVHITSVLGLHGSTIMIKDCLYDTVTDSLFMIDIIYQVCFFITKRYLCYYKLRVLWTVQEELLGNVSEGDLAVGQGDCPDGGLDHVVVQSDDEGVSVVRGELVSKLLDYLREPHQVP